MRKGRVFGGNPTTGNHRSVVEMDLPLLDLHHAAVLHNVHALLQPALSASDEPISAHGKDPVTSLDESHLNLGSGERGRAEDEDGGRNGVEEDEEEEDEEEDDDQHEVGDESMTRTMTKKRITFEVTPFPS